MDGAGGAVEEAGADGGAKCDEVQVAVLEASALGGGLGHDGRPPPLLLVRVDNASESYFPLVAAWGQFHGILFSDVSFTRCPGVSWMTFKKNVVSILVTRVWLLRGHGWRVFLHRVLVGYLPC